MLEAEDVVAMVKELTNGIIGFNNEEIKEILAYVTTSQCNIFLTAIFLFFCYSNFYFKLIRCVQLFNIYVKNVCTNKDIIYIQVYMLGVSEGVLHKNM